jgi:hypothetical protein
MNKHALRAALHALADASNRATSALLEEIENEVRIELHDPDLELHDKQGIRQTPTACECARTLTVTGKCSDLASAEYGTHRAHGYAPVLPGLTTDSDYLELVICCDCGKLQDFEPWSPSQVHAALRKM